MLSSSDPFTSLEQPHQLVVRLIRTLVLPAANTQVFWCTCVFTLTLVYLGNWAEINSDES